MSRQKLPIGIQTFREIREEGHYYVDKSAIARQLIEEGKYYFLSRPRRFGKSLFLDTLAELFEGNEPLFRGLAVHDQWDWGRRYPVLRLSFGGGVIRDAADLQGKIGELLTINEQALGLSCTQVENRARFAELIRSAERQAGQRVVVLVDEYDKPILDNLTRPQIAREIRDELRNLYSVIKDSDAHIRFAMLTGVSKFSKVSLFSGLNNLNDITIDARYSAICGYTDEDVDTVFAPELAGLDRDEIRRWYNGYNWMGTSVYNPFDLLLLFQKREFRPYWFETGTPTFLIDLLTARRTFLPDLERVMALESLLSSFDVEQIPSEALMFQAGYLTIDSVRRLPGQLQMTLRYPNLEVRSSLNSALLQAWGDNPARPATHLPQLYDRLLANDFPGLQRLFEAFFASIPHDWYRNNPIAQYEGYWASVFYSHFAALGLDIRLEDTTHHGRIDMTVLFNGHVYLFEFKVVELVPEGKALQQLIERGYADKYRARGEPIHLIGVEFSRERRSVVGFEVIHL
ncbi:ATP-binding protein [Pseudomonas stutzeri]|nr:ATP-binding protein [Stutzerimonas stutzeri]